MSSLLIPAAQIVVGFVALVAGGELLVRGAAALAVAARISPLVIGLTIVAFGTSAPELAVTVQSAWAGLPDLAVGNAVGSNIANILLVLGSAALIGPLLVQSRVIRIDVPLVIAASVGLWLLSLDGTLGRLDGALLLVVLIAYLAWSVHEGRQEPAELQEEFAETLPEGRSGAGHFGRQVVLVLVGLVLLVVSARVLVDGASEVARTLGVSELVIGLTIVAIGTSLPELVASVMASIRGQRDIAVGNVVGSNLFNILGVLGVGALVAPAGIAVPRQALTLDMPIMIAATLLCLPVFFTGRRITRVEGGVLLGYFVAYIAYVVMGAVGSSSIRSFELAMIGFVIPLTLVAVVFSLYQSFAAGRD